MTGIAIIVIIAVIACADLFVALVRQDLAPTALLTVSGARTFRTGMKLVLNGDDRYVVCTVLDATTLEIAPEVAPLFVRAFRRIRK